MQTRIADGGKCKEQDCQGLSLASLIARLEKATGTDRELDIAICIAVSDYSETAFRQWKGARPKGSSPTLYDFLSSCLSSRYTGSIDAAMTLVPEYISSELTSSAAGAFTRCRLWDWRRSPTMSDPGNEWKSEGNRPLVVNICIAALKAVAEMRRNAPGDTGLLSGVTSEQKDSTP